MATEVKAVDNSAKVRTAATPLSTLAAGKNYWPVELVRPPGVSEGVTAYITLAEGAIQNAVDLLGRGVPKPPPDVKELLQPSVYEIVGKGEATDAYQQIIDTVEATQTWLLMEDSKVIKTSVKVAAEQNMTLRGIQRIVTELNTKLKAVGTAKLKPAQETALLKLIVNAIEAVYKKVTAVAELNEDIANGGEKPNPNKPAPIPPGGNNGGGGGGGGGPSILEQLMPMLGMVPMMAMPLVQMIPELLKKDEPAEDDRGREEPVGQTPPPAAAAPPPGDPNAQPPGDPNAPPPAESNGAPPAGAPATPVSAMMRPAARSRRRTDEQAGSAVGTTPQDEDIEEDDAEAPPEVVDI
ncbi:hypothetical protein ACFQZZ_24345 [Nocardia sp. GCM10030253]|uniref:hypothetical protein n=1 Tax=Nocardia sp. GCM10030253 TaxID=3273404 RepID=UPI003644CEE6